MLLTLDDPCFPLCGQFIINYMDNLLLQQHICTAQLEIQIYQIIYVDQFDWLHDKFGSELLLIWLLSNALWHWVVSFIPARFSTGTRSSRIWPKQYLRRRTPRTAIEDDQQCWAPCQRCSLSRGWSFDLRTPLSFESRPISSVFSSCFFFHQYLDISSTWCLVR